MVDHILVPFDGSELATKALKFAIEEYSGATITALHVIDPVEFTRGTGFENGVGYARMMEDMRDRSENILESAREVAASQGVDIETESVIGQTSRSINEYIETNEIDHVVIGSHGRGGVSRILLGSVAETVARRSAVPVTIIR